MEVHHSKHFQVSEHAALKKFTGEEEESPHPALG